MIPGQFMVQNMTKILRCITCLSPRLSPSPPRLEVKFLTSLLQSLHSLLGPPRKVNMDGGSHASAEVGGAGVDVAVLGVQYEVLPRLSLDRVTDSLDTTGKTLKDTTDVTTW